MLEVAALLFFLAGIGAATLGVRYLIGPVPTNYHMEILEKGEVAATGALITILTALYRIVGGLLVAISIGLMVIAVFGVLQDAFWAKVTALTIGVIAATSAVQSARMLERETGVRTPWRSAAALIGQIVLAFVLSVL